MVAIKIKTLILTLILFIGFGLSAQARISALESNQAYSSLIKELEQNSKQEQSKAKELEQLREKYAIESNRTPELTNKILNNEGELFDLRSKKGTLEAKIAILEQEYLSKQASNTTNKPTKTNKVLFTKENADITKNQALVDELTEQDYQSLLRVHEGESSVSNYIRIFTSNNQLINSIAKQYNSTNKQSEADSLYSKYMSLSKLNIKISDSVEVIWNNIFEQKSYLYSYIFDKHSKNEVIEQFSKDSFQALAEGAELKGKYASDAIAAYPAQRRAMVNYEISLCELLGLSKAQQALQVKAKSIESLKYNFSKVILQKRNFLDYQDTKFGKMPYKTSAAIAKCPIYPKGTMYRILVGTFNKAQLPNIFRQTMPLYQLREKDGKYSYFVGGYPTLAKAKAEEAKLKKHGFRNPRAVKWQDGIYTNLSEHDDTDEAIYNLEVNFNQADLPEQVKQLIKITDSELGISRIINGDNSYTFIIGVFSNHEKAVDLKEKITILHNKIIPTIKKL